MPCYKDTTRGTWYCKFSYQDWTGTRRQKLKRGFATKRKAAAWERDFLERYQNNPHHDNIICLLRGPKGRYAAAGHESERRLVLWLHTPIYSSL